MRRKEGISLIVLVITIIVIIILAGSVILSLSNNNPIKQATEASFKNNVRTYDSDLSMTLSKKYLDDTSFNPNTLNASTWNGTGPTANTVKDYITSITKDDAAKFEIRNGKLVYVGTDVTEKQWLTDIGTSTATTVAVNVIATANSTINGAFPAYNNPIIPKGFKAVNDGVVWPTDWNKGLVIEDANGNQFVWVPVDGTNVAYVKWCTAGYAYNDVNVSADTLPSGIVENTQITKYGGFYVARYEAGNAASVLVSKKNATIWNNIDYATSKTKAEAMYTTAEVKSGLLTGTEWDTLMEWLKDSGKNVTDSRTWGNHSDSTAPANVAGYGTLKTAGFSENWKANNLYDIAGNVFEYTNEKYNSTPITRGGHYICGGASESVSCRHDTGGGDVAIGFRVVLYVL